MVDCLSVPETALMHTTHTQTEKQEWRLEKMESDGDKDINRGFVH